MKLLSGKRCVIGEGPIWNEREERLYFTNGFQHEICIYDFKTEQVHIRTLPFGVSALAFDKQNRLIVSMATGVYVLSDDDKLMPLYDTVKHQIRHAGDMKVGPDGALYVGTVSEKFLGISENVDGKLYRISPNGEVEILLENLLLSNGLDWSIDEKKFYHVDTGVSTIKEYFFDKNTGKISFSGRQVCVEGADGLTVGQDNCLYVSCAWKKYIAVIDGEKLSIMDYIYPPQTFPMSCAFCGKNMDILAVTTASDTADFTRDKNAGFTILQTMDITGRKPYIYPCRGKNENENF